MTLHDQRPCSHAAQRSRDIESEHWQQQTMGLICGKTKSKGGEQAVEISRIEAHEGERLAPGALPHA
jgi:hypothetical protein